MSGDERDTRAADSEHGSSPSVDPRVIRAWAGELAATLRHHESLGCGALPRSEVRALWETVREVRRLLDAPAGGRGAERAAPGRSRGAVERVSTNASPAPNPGRAHPAAAPAKPPQVDPDATTSPRRTSPPTSDASNTAPANEASTTEASAASRPLWGTARDRSARRDAARATAPHAPAARSAGPSPERSAPQPRNAARPAASPPSGTAQPQGPDYPPDLPPPSSAPWEMYEDLDALPPHEEAATPQRPAPRTPAEHMARAREDLGDCRACRLCEGRRTIVWGTGDTSARLLFVGEGPGQNEDATGEPFVGDAGKLLDRMIEAMKLTRDGVYIANVVKCRPPGNRNPHDDEIAECIPHLNRQIEIVKPEVIVALGAVATSALLGRRSSIRSLRGTWQSYRSIPLLPTYHPAYLLRTPAAKKSAWEDLQKVMERLGLPR